MRKNKPARKVTTIVLCSRMNNEVVRGTLIDIQEIEGKMFYVIEQNGRIIKLAKDGYSTVKV